MRAGQLRHSITIEQVTETKSASGALNESWATFAAVRAKVDLLSGREYVSAGGTNAENITEFTIRYLPGITLKMRILFDGSYYDIKPPLKVITSDRNRTLVLTAVEYVK